MSTNERDDIRPADDAGEQPTEGKRAWKAPTIEALDYADTEAGSGAPNPVDFATYAS